MKSMANDQETLPQKASEIADIDLGIETLLKVTASTDQRLSDMADNKAQILITVNSIIISAIISLVLRKLKDNSFLVLPSYLLLTVSLATMILAILSTRPSIPRGSLVQKILTIKKLICCFLEIFTV
jgi:hypothetical protein